MVDTTFCLFSPRFLDSRDIAKADDTQIRKALQIITSSLNDDFKEKNIFALLSSHASSKLKSEMEDIIMGPAMDFCECFGDFKRVAPNKIKVGGFFYVDYIKKTKGENYFIFEKVNNRWRLLKTNFHRKLKPLIWND